MVGSVPLIMDNAFQNMMISFIFRKLMPGGGLDNHPLFQHTTLVGKTVFGGVYEGVQGKFESH